MSLVDDFLELANFQAAWERVLENAGCAGVDGVTVDRFCRDGGRALLRLRDGVRDGRYRAMPLRQLFIPKKDGKWRELGVPTVGDRVVQQALLNVVRPRLELGFEDCSYGYRRGRSHLMAVDAVRRCGTRGLGWVLDADITSYFTNVGHDRLMVELEERLFGVRIDAEEERDAALVRGLVRGWIGAGVLTKGGIVLPERGLPQGAPISPILANVFLDDLDKMLLGAGFEVVRFADDFVVLGRSRERVLEAERLVEVMLGEMGLCFHPEKTRVTSFREGFRFLGHVFVGEIVVREEGGKRKKRDETRRSEGSRSAAGSGAMRLVYVDRGSRGPTGMEMALVAALRGSREPIPPPLFVVLGFGVRGDVGRVDVASGRGKQDLWRVEMPVLYLTEQGTVVREVGDRFSIVLPGEAAVELLMREVSGILVFGNVQLTTPVLGACLRLGIGVTFLGQMGGYKGSLVDERGGTLGRVRAQFLAGESWELEVARAIVLGKLWNSRMLLMRLNRKRGLEGVAAVCAGLEADMAKLRGMERTGDAVTIDRIRGYEGAGAARYFSGLGLLISGAGFEWGGRSFHPPKDPFNSLLSFGYTLLMNGVLGMILVEGLNAGVGVLHGRERERVDLAFDLMEEWRSVIVDSLVMEVVNKGVIKVTDFSWVSEEGGIYLTKRAKRVFLKQFEDRMCLLMSHPDVGEQVSYRRAIQLQVRRYVRAVEQQGVYEPFRRLT